jgi:hypothetical protein
VALCPAIERSHRPDLGPNFDFFPLSDTRRELIDALGQTRGLPVDAPARLGGNGFGRAAARSAMPAYDIERIGLGSRHRPASNRLKGAALFLVKKVCRIGAQWDS